MASNYNNSLLSCRSRISECLGYVILAQALSWVKMSAKTTLHSSGNSTKFERSNFQDGSLTWVASAPLLLAIGLNFSPPQSCLRVLITWWLAFLRREVEKKARQKHQCLLCQASKIIHCNSLKILLVTQVKPSDLGRWSHKIKNARGYGSLDTILKVGYHNLLLCNISTT